MGPVVLTSFFLKREKKKKKKGFWLVILIHHDIQVENKNINISLEIPKKYGPTKAL